MTSLILVAGYLIDCKNLVAKSINFSTFILHHASSHTWLSVSSVDA